MANPISNDMRAAIVKHMQAGKDKREIAKWLFVCTRTVTRVWNRFITSLSYEPKPPNSGRKPLVSDETMEQVVVKVKEMPDMTLVELIEEFNLPISESALCRRLIRLGLSLKKRRSIQMGENAKMLQ